MPAIPLGKAAYERSQMPPLLLKNMIFETAPTNLADQVSLIPRPRLKSFSTPGSGPINGMYRKGGVLAGAGNSGAIFALSNNTLYKVNQTTGVATSLGSVSGGLRLSMEGNTWKVAFTRGTTLYKSDGNSIDTVTMDYNTYAVDWLNGYFLAASDLGRVYWSDITDQTDVIFDPLDFATAESAPDDLFSLKVIGDELWLFGRLSTEVWQPTGNAAAPFQRIDGRVFSIGVTARDTVVKSNIEGRDTVIWLGTDRAVYMTAPNPTKISDASIDEKLRRITVDATNNAVNPWACEFSWDGHRFYVLHLPTEGSFAYDLSTGCWCELTSLGQDLFRGAVSAVGPNAQVLLGDGYAGRIWEMTITQKTDGEDPVEFEVSGLVQVRGAPERCNSVQMEVGTGFAASPLDDPTIDLSYSDDMGRSYCDPMPEPLGRQGENPRVAWTRLGLVRQPGRVFRWQTTEPVTVRGATYNESLRF